MLVVVARNGASLGGQGFSAFLVERGAAGLVVSRHEEKMGQRGSSTVALAFDDVAVPESALLGQVGQGMRVALTGLGGGRIGVAAMAVGVAQAALEAARDHATQRRQFDLPLGAFQAVRIMLADAATALAAAWQLLSAEHPDLHLLVVGPFEPQDPVPAETAYDLLDDI